MPYAKCRDLFILMLNVVMLNVVMLNVVMLNVVMLNVVILNVLAPGQQQADPVKKFRSAFAQIFVS